MKKKGFVFIFLLLLSAFIMPNVFAQEAPKYETIENVKKGTKVEVFFANGTPITISERDDGQDGALITWEGGSQLVSPQVSVFGAGHNSDTRYETTSITMNGGTVRNVVGGGLHKSNVGTTNVIINGGQLMAVQGGGSASFIYDAEYPTEYYNGDAALSPNRTEVANVTIVNGGRNTLAATYNLVYGGGEGISYTGTANLEVQGGTWDYVTAGGSNGRTDNSTLTVTGGKIEVLQSVNRGSMDSAAIEITGGEIKNAYAGGEVDPNVNGKISDITMQVSGTAKVENLLVGTNGGSTISAKDIAKVAYNENNVTNVDETTFTTDNIVKTVTITIDVMGVTESVEVEKGSALTAAEIEELKAINLEELGLEGYELEGYYTDNTYTTEFDFTQSFDEDVTIYLHAVEKPKETETEQVKNPDTSDINMSLIITIMSLSMTGLGYTIKKEDLINLKR